MAIGNATVVGRHSHDDRPVFMDILQFTGDGGYPTGGSAAFQQYVRAAVGRGSLEIIAAIPLDHAGGYRPYYDSSVDKLKIYTNAGAEVANTTDLSASTMRLLIISV